MPKRDPYAKLARDNNINFNTYRSRVKAGWTREKAATTPLILPTRIRDPFSEVARNNGINVRTYRNRIGRGWSREKAATTPTSPQPQISQERIHYREIAKENGIDRPTYNWRVKNGWSYEEAATVRALTLKEAAIRAKAAADENRRIKQKEALNDPDDIFTLTPRHKEIAKMNGICEGTVHSRIYAAGWTVEEAITTPVQIKYKGNRELYEHYRDIAEKNGISKKTFTSRVNKSGWSFEKAATTKVERARYKNPEREYWVNQARENGLTYDLFRDRVQSGWTMEEAATTKRLPRGTFLNEQRKKNSVDSFRRFQYGKEK